MARILATRTRDCRDKVNFAGAMVKWLITTTLFLKQTYILGIMLMIVDSLLKPIATSLRKIMVLENLPPTFILVKRICLTLHHVYGT